MKEIDQQIALCQWAGMANPHKPTAEELKSGSYYQYEPDFNDLNLIHRLEEKFLTGDGWRERLERYSTKLMVVMRETDFGKIDVAFYNDNVGLRYYTIHASAAQRREALLRCLNLWREDSNEGRK